MRFATEASVACAGVLIAAWASWRLKAARAFDAWPRARARVTQVELRGDGDGGCFVEIDATYELDGVRHTAVRLSPISSAVGQREASRLRAELMANGEVWVRYDPRYPSVGYVSNRGDGAMFLVAVAGVALILFAALRVGWLL